MCLPTEGKDWGYHECITECPLCWIFLPANNRHRLVAGEKIDIGELGDLVDAHDAGCRFATLWVEIILNSEYGGRYPLESRLTVFVDEDARTLPADIRELSLHITESMQYGGVVKNLGLGVRETTYHGHTVTLGVFARKEDPIAAFLKRRAAEFNVDNDGAYQTALGWLSECEASHNHCPKQVTGMLPTRVLDLSADNGLERVRLKVTDGETAKYIALSYCWGTTTQVITTEETLPSFVNEGIDIKKLPKTLQDAIHTARQLNIPYLWIDSLCIVQDSAEDIAAEITKMPQIYKQAILTINAAAATDCDDGFLHPREEVMARIDASFRLLYPLSENEGTETLEILSQPDLDMGIIYICEDRYCGYKVKKFGEEPASKRAWTLQETWLSPRMLIYGSGPLQWQCLTAAHSLGGSPPSDPNQEFVPSNDRHKFFQPLESRTESSLLSRLENMNMEEGMGSQNEEQLNESHKMENISWNRAVDLASMPKIWRSIVSSYTHRAMTNPDDKLPALSGIAAEFKRLSGDTYLAGLWEKGLPFDLLWHQKPQPPWFADRRWKPPNYRAPSWSWAAQDGMIIFKTPSRSDAISDIVIHSVSTSPATLIAPMSKVTDGSIVLSGPMRRLTWADVQMCFVICDLDRSADMYWDYIIPDNGLRNQYFKYPASNEQFQHPEINIHTITWAEIEDMKLPRPEMMVPPSLEDGAREYVFLEIARGPEPTGIVLTYVGDGAYKRIGFFFLGRREIDESEKYENINSPGTRWWDWDEALRICELKII